MTLLQQSFADHTSFRSPPRSRAKHVRRHSADKFSGLALSDDDEDETTHALELLQVALHTQLKNPAMARRVTNARRSYHQNAALRQALVRDMGSLCQALADTLKSARDASDHCLEFVIDVLRLALQHEPQELPFRLTIFAEVCVHARRHSFVFDVLQLLLDQSRESTDRCDMLRYLLRGSPHSREPGSGVVTCILSTVTDGSNAVLVRAATGLLYDLACSVPHDLAFCMLKEAALPKLVAALHGLVQLASSYPPKNRCHGVQRQTDSALPPQSHVELSQQLLTVFEKVMYHHSVSEEDGCKGDGRRMTEARRHVQSALVTALPATEVVDMLCTAFRLLLAERICKHASCALFHQAAWMASSSSSTDTFGCCKASPADTQQDQEVVAEPATVFTTGGLGLPLASRLLQPLVRLLRTFATSEQAALQEVVVRSDGVAWLVGCMLLQPMSDAICSVACEALEGVIHSRHVSVLQSVLTGPASNLLTLLDALPDYVVSSHNQAQYRTGCAAAMSRVVHAINQQLSGGQQQQVVVSSKWPAAAAPKPSCQPAPPPPPAAASMPCKNGTLVAASPAHHHHHHQQQQQHVDYEVDDASGPECAPQCTSPSSVMLLSPLSFGVFSPPDNASALPAPSSSPPPQTHAHALCSSEQEEEEEEQEEGSSLRAEKTTADTPLSSYSSSLKDGASSQHGYLIDPRYWVLLMAVTENADIWSRLLHRTAAARAHLGLRLMANHHTVLPVKLRKSVLSTRLAHTASSESVESNTPCVSRSDSVPLQAAVDAGSTVLLQHISEPIDVGGTVAAATNGTHLCDVEASSPCCPMDVDGAVQCASDCEMLRDDDEAVETSQPHPKMPSFGSFHACLEPKRSRHAQHRRDECLQVGEQMAISEETNNGAKAKTAAVECL